VGAHLANLKRTRAGEFRIEESVTMDELEKKAEEGTATNLLVSMNAALHGLRFVHLTAEEARRVSHGVAVNLRSKESVNYRHEERVRMLDESETLVAIGAYDSQREVLRPVVVFA
jgi:tRNA pseudouridine55 synthase